MNTHRTKTHKLEIEAQNALMSYVHGWKIGASAGAFIDTLKSNPDFMAGHEAGRKAKMDAYAEACKTYGTSLSPLR